MNSSEVPESQEIPEVTPELLPLQELGEGERMIREAITPSPEQLAAWQEEFWRLMRPFIDAQLEEKAERYMSMAAKMLYTKTFGIFLEELPEGILWAAGEHNKIDIVSDPQVTPNYIEVGNATRVISSYIEPLLEKIEAFITANEPKIREALAVYYDTCDEAVLVTSLITETPQTKPGESPLSESEHIQRVAEVTQAAIASNGVGRPEIGTNLDRIFRRNLSRVDLETTVKPTEKESSEQKFHQWVIENTLSLISHEKQRQGITIRDIQWDAQSNLPLAILSDGTNEIIETSHQWNREVLEKTDPHFDSDLLTSSAVLDNTLYFYYQNPKSGVKSAYQQAQDYCATELYDYGYGAESYPPDLYHNWLLGAPKGVWMGALPQRNNEPVAFTHNKPNPPEIISKREEKIALEKTPLGTILFRSEDDDQQRVVRLSEGVPITILEAPSAYDLSIQLNTLAIFGQKPDSFYTVAGYTYIGTHEKVLYFTKDEYDPYEEGELPYAERAALSTLCDYLVVVGMQSLAQRLRDKEVTAASICDLIREFSDFSYESNDDLEEIDATDIRNFSSCVRHENLQTQCTVSAYFLAAALRIAFPNANASVFGGYLLTEDEDILQIVHAQVLFVLEGEKIILDSSPIQPYPEEGGSGSTPQYQEESGGYLYEFNEEHDLATSRRFAPSPNKPVRRRFSPSKRRLRNPSQSGATALQANDVPAEKSQNDESKEQQYPLLEACESSEKALEFLLENLQRVYQVDSADQLYRITNALSPRDPVRLAIQASLNYHYGDENKATLEDALTLLATYSGIDEKVFAKSHLPYYQPAFLKLVTNLVSRVKRSIPQPSQGQPTT